VRLIFLCQSSHCGEPYAPVRKQLLKLLFLTNQKRKAAGYKKVPADVFRYRRDIVKVFEPGSLTAQFESHKCPKLLCGYDLSYHFAKVLLPRLGYLN